MHDDDMNHPEIIQSLNNMSNFDAMVNSIWNKEDIGRRSFERQLATSFEPTPLPEGCFSLQRSSSHHADNHHRLDDVTSFLTLFPEFSSSDEPIADHCSDDFFDDIPKTCWPQSRNCNEVLRDHHDKIRNQVGNVINANGSFHQPSSCEEQNLQDDATEMNGSEMLDDAENPSASRRWQERYNELVMYKQRFGNCCVPSQWAENPPLAQWVKRQRYQFKLKNEGHHSTMSTERKIALDKLGFTWDPHTAFWEERLEELERFREENGHANVPTKYPQNPQAKHDINPGFRYYQRYSASVVR